MATAATSLLGLALPVTGELSGTWGDTVNVSITALLDTAVAGTTTLSSDADVTLTTTTLAANQARQAIILWTAGGTVTRTITAPAQSKSYIVINKTSSSQSIKIVGVGPTTGVTIVAGTAAFVVWNGVDFVTASVTSTTGILPVANGGTGLSSGTSGGVLAYTATGTLASSAALAASALVIGGGAGAAPSTTTTGTGVVTALGVNVGTAGAFVVNGGALGTPSSGTVTNLTGTASININGTVGATTESTGAFTTLSATGNANFGNAGSSTYGGYATGGRIFSLAAAGGVIPAISASTDTFAGSTAFRAYTKEYSNDTSYAFEIQTGNGTGVTTQKLQLTWGANGLWNSTGLAVTGTLSATGTLSGGTSGTGYSFSGSAPATSLTLDSSGQLGIGEATPTQKVHAKTASTTYYLAETTGTSASAGFRMKAGASADYTLFTTQGVNQFAIYDNASAAERLTLSSAGNLGLGVTPSAWNSAFRALELKNSAGFLCDGDTAFVVNNCYFNTSNAWIYKATDFATRYQQQSGTNKWFIAPSGTAGNPITFTQAMTLDASGNLGIGVTSPLNRLDVRAASAIIANYQTIQASSTDSAAIDLGGGIGLGGYYSGTASFATFGNIVGRKENGTDGNYAGYLAFGTNAQATGVVERMRLDSSGNLGIGVTSIPSFTRLAVTGTAGAQTDAKQQITVNAPTTTAGEGAGIRINAASGAKESVGIIGVVNNATGNLGSMTFGVYNGGATVPEYMRLDNSGNLFVAKTTQDTAVVGIELLSDGRGNFTVSSNEVLNIKRLASDGNLIRFFQDATEEGNISVSGTTVSYNGGHLSRWAQTTTAKDESIVKGTVLSNLDEMNVYTDSEGNPVDNEQLNKVKVSDVEGDANVAGVFVNWTHDDAHDVDEINMAMTGDMIIRIAQGTTVARGNLLMSAGDGTAKPQGDDIVRSKTVAKVTSNHITCTYTDGSYCVPCVLMAC